MNAGDVRRALIRHCDWWSSLVIPEFELGGDRLDVMQVTKSGFAVGYEIKVSSADWKRDLRKPKWGLKFGNPFGSQYLSRFYWVVPGHRTRARDDYALDIRRPADLPAGTGIIAVIDGLYCREIVASKRVKVPPLPDAIRRQAMDAFYYRFWRLERTHRDTLEDYKAVIKQRNELRAKLALAGTA